MPKYKAPDTEHNSSAVSSRGELLRAKCVIARLARGQCGAQLKDRAYMPRDKHGRHEYDPVDYGLNSTALRQRFQFYYERFSSDE